MRIIRQKEFGDNSFLKTVGSVVSWAPKTAWKLIKRVPGPLALAGMVLAPKQIGADPLPANHYANIKRTLPNPTAKVTFPFQPTTATNDQINTMANDVMSGKYGNNDARRKALGANYNAVQARVNQLVKTNNLRKTTTPTTSTVAKPVMTTPTYTNRINSMKPSTQNRNYAY